MGTPKTPSLNTSKTVKRIPKKMIPRRRTFLTANFKPGVIVFGIRITTPISRPRTIANITGDTGLFSNPISCLPMNSLIQMLTHVKTKTAEIPGRSLGRSLIATPNKFFSQAGTVGVVSLGFILDFASYLIFIVRI